MGRCHTSGKWCIVSNSWTAIQRGIDCGSRRGIFIPCRPGSHPLKTGMRDETMTNETAQHAPQEKASLQAVRAFVQKHAPQQSPEDVQLFVNDLMRLLRVVIREAAYDVTNCMTDDLRGGR